MRRFKIRQKMISLLLVLPMALMAQGSRLWPAASLAETWDDNARIVGGANAAEGEYPYQISLKNTSNNNHICGGSILTAQTIVIAGHCIYHRKPDELYVFCGAANLNSSDGKIYHPKTHILHEGYVPTTLDNDLAIIKLKESIVMTSKIKTIALSTTYVGAGKKCTVSGWGFLQFPNPIPTNDLKFLKVDTISVKDCKTTPKRLCTTTTNGKGACMGDSGGPLTLDGKLVGVVSHGIPCATGSPDKYSRVTAYIDWIKKHGNVIIAV